MKSVELSDLKNLIRDKFPAWVESRSIMTQLSSLELVELVDAVEARFGVRFTPLDLDESRFENAESLRALVAELQARG